MNFTPTEELNNKVLTLSQDCIKRIRQADKPEYLEFEEERRYQTCLVI